MDPASAWVGPLGWVSLPRGPVCWGGSRFRMGRSAGAGLASAWVGLLGRVSLSRGSVFHIGTAPEAKPPEAGPDACTERDTLGWHTQPVPATPLRAWRRRRYAEYDPRTTRTWPTLSGTTAAPAPAPRLCTRAAALSCTPTSRPGSAPNATTGLRMSALRMPALRMSALRMSALRMSALRMSALRMSALRMPALRPARCAPNSRRAEFPRPCRAVMPRGARRSLRTVLSAPRALRSPRPRALRAPAARGPRVLLVS